jgi:hypothetical protein
MRTIKNKIEAKYKKEIFDLIFIIRKSGLARDG